MKRSSDRLRLGLVGLLLLAAGCGEGHLVAVPGPTNTPANTPTQTRTLTATVTVTSSPTHTAVPTITATPTSTLTPTSTRTPIPTATITFTQTPSTTPTITPGTEVTARLDLDIRWSADVVLDVLGNGLTAKLTLSDAREVAAAGVALEGTGSVHALPEADAVLYAAKLASPPVVDGRCGSQPVSLSLTLFRRNGNDRVVGGIAAYCGANTYSGSPARVLRLSGVLPSR